MDVKYGLDDQYISQLSKKLAVAVSNTMVLYVKTLNGHWNLQSSSFISIHKMLEEQYTQLAENLDLLAERIRMTGQTPPSSMKDFLGLATLDEMGTSFTLDTLMEALASSHEQVMQELRNLISFCDEHGDPGTSDLLAGLLRDHEKAAWFLRSHLQSA